MVLHIDINSNKNLCYYGMYASCLLLYATNNNETLHSFVSSRHQVDLRIITD